MNDEQLSKKEAIDFYHSEVWKDWPLEKIARFQLFQDRMCLPFELFHKAISQLLGRPVYTSEFVANAERLREEYLTLKIPPTLGEIIEMIPEEKRLLVNVGDLKQ